MDTNYQDGTPHGSMGYRLCCFTLFVTFSFCYLYFYQNDVLATAQYILSHGQTHYHRLWGGLFITALLTLFQLAINSYFKLRGSIYVLSYVPSFLLLTSVTAMRINPSEGVSWGWWCWATPILIAISLWMMQRAKQWQMNDVHEITPLLSGRALANYVGMLLLFAFVSCFSNHDKLLHYQVGIFNGQGINTKDVDQRKDVIGGIWVMPVKGLRVGVFGWEGSVARRGTWSNAAGVSHSGVRSLPKHRYALSGEYKVNDWTVRSEYVHSTGKAFSTTITNTNAQDPNFKNYNISSLGDKADGFYGLVIAPVVKNKFHLKARYDLYRANAEWNHARTQYEVGADYLFHKNVQLNVEYARVNDRSLSKHNFNLVDVELDFRF